MAWRCCAQLSDRGLPRAGFSQTRLRSVILISNTLHIKGQAMLRQAAVWTALVVLAICTLAGCSKPPYLVPGLTLPPGATVTMQKPRQHTFPAQPPSRQAFSFESVFISFDCTQNWDQVSQHIRQCLQRAGLRETTKDMLAAFNQRVAGSEEGLEELVPVLQEPLDSGKPSSGGPSSNLFSKMRFYEKTGQYSVTISDMSSTIGGSIPGTYCYVMQIIKYHKL